jgi:hypothetical protein
MTNNFEQGKTWITAQDLETIRNNTDREALFAALGLQRDEHKSNNAGWWSLSPFSSEKTPSFVFRANGKWFCHSTGCGGSVIELVMRLKGFSDCYTAARWLLDEGISSLDGTITNKTKAEGRIFERSTEKEMEVVPNKPISTNLVPFLTFEGASGEFLRRGIGWDSCQALGVGFLPNKRDFRGALQNRIVFQVRGVVEKNKKLQPVILTHCGRATTQEQELKDGKYYNFKGFKKSYELYNIDTVLLNKEAVRQAKACGYVLLLEGMFDVLKLYDAGVYNAVGSFGASFSEKVLPRFKLIAEKLDIDTFFIWYDHDQAGFDGTAKALSLLTETGFKVKTFDWNMQFESGNTTLVTIPAKFKDACDFSTKQLQWLRQKSII